MRAGAVFASIVLGAILPACIVSFDDYPVADPDAGSGGGGFGGSAGWPDGAADVGGGAAGGGGAGGGGGSAASDGAAGSGGTGGTGATGGAGGSAMIECSDFVAGRQGGTCYAYASGQAPSVGDCTALGNVIAMCDALCLRNDGEICKPGEPKSTVTLGLLCHLDEIAPTCAPICDNQLTFAHSIDRTCNTSGDCQATVTDCGNYLCDLTNTLCKSQCTDNSACLPNKICTSGACQSGT